MVVSIVKKNWKDFTHVVIYEALPKGFPIKSVMERLGQTSDKNIKIVSRYNSLTKKWKDGYEDLNK